MTTTATCRRPLAIGLLLVTGAGAGSWPTRTRAADALRDELAVVARQIAGNLKDLDEDSLAIGQFTCPPQFAASAGPGIVKILAEELGKHAIAVRREARVGLMGKYVVDQLDPDQAKPAVARIVGDLVDRGGRVLLTFTREIRDALVLASLFGLTVELPADRPGVVRDRTLKDRFARPAAYLAGRRIAAGPGSPYALEILVLKDGQYQPRAPRDENGLTFVQIDRGERYALRLINDSPHDAAVTVTIDGLNLFAFSENPNYSYVIVPAKRPGFINGWHRTNATSEAFEVTGYGSSAAAELLQNHTGVGTITVSFAAAWPNDAPPPADEYAARFATRGSANATGRGPQVEQRYREVERVTGVVRASVSVRYARPD